MSATTVQTRTEPVTATLKLHSSAEGKQETEYRYSHLLPFFSQDHYPPLTPFEHIDPGHRALNHSNPRSFLDSATQITELTPNLGTEVFGVDLRALDSDGRDQLALEVCRKYRLPITSICPSVGRSSRSSRIQRSTRVHRCRSRFLPRMGVPFWPVTFFPFATYFVFNWLNAVSNPGCIFIRLLGILRIILKFILFTEMPILVSTLKLMIA